jgi:hypothetical protein
MTACGSTIFVGAVGHDGKRLPKLSQREGACVADLAYNFVDGFAGLRDADPLVDFASRRQGLDPELRLNEVVEELSNAVVIEQRSEFATTICPDSRSAADDPHKVTDGVVVGQRLLVTVPTDRFVSDLATVGQEATELRHQRAEQDAYQPNNSRCHRSTSIVLLPQSMPESTAARHQMSASRSETAA